MIFDLLHLSIEQRLLNELQTTTNPPSPALWELAIRHLLADIAKERKSILLPSVSELEIDSPTHGGTISRLLAKDAVLDLDPAICWRSHSDDRPPHDWLLEERGWFVPRQKWTGEPGHQKVWIWGSLGNVELVTVCVYFAEKRIARLEMKCATVADLVNGPELKLSYGEIWWGLARFFPRLVEWRRGQASLARNREEKVNFQTAILQRLFGPF